MPAPDRPWWGNPAVWIVASGVFLVLGLVVAPRLFGFTLILLPFIWMSGRRDARSDR